MFYLHHYFEPDFSHVRRTPQPSSFGASELRYLGYVQNIVAGQVLAEIIDLEEFPDTHCDPRFIYSNRHLPVGPNCQLHPENPNKIIAAVNGYVFYHNGLISVKKLLNVRGNVGFHTGNIFFIGDLAVHGDVQTGFSVKANNLLVRGHIESAKVKAIGDIVCLAGVKGASVSTLEANSPQTGPLQADADEYLPGALIEAGGNIRLPFCEHVQLRAGGNIVIDGSCLHSTIYVNGNLLIKGRLLGGTVYANGLVYIENQLGGDYSVNTRVMMGYNPFEFLALQKLESQIAYIKGKLTYYSNMAARNSVMKQEYAPRVLLAERKLRILIQRHKAMWDKFSVDEQNAPKCRIVVPGTVMPGCEIGIAKAYYKTTMTKSNVNFALEGTEIVSRSNKGGDAPPQTPPAGGNHFPGDISRGTTP